MAYKGQSDRRAAPEEANARRLRGVAILFVRGPWTSEQGSALADDVCCR